LTAVRTLLGGVKIVHHMILSHSYRTVFNQSGLRKLTAKASTSPILSTVKNTIEFTGTQETSDLWQHWQGVTLK
jgi:hypothetical protein